MIEPADAGLSQPRAYLRVGGSTLARHQLALVLAAGCERIVCLARALDPELIQLQHTAERAGARFHMIANAHGLAGLVTAADELLVIGEGLVPAAADAIALVQKPVVVVLPAESGQMAGFERVDAAHAAAGLMLLPGYLVERLQNLPEDSDLGSALLRIALQGGVQQRLLPDSIRASGHWLMVRGEAAAHAAELEWVERQTRGQGRSPGNQIAAFLVRRFGPSLLHAGGGARAFILAALALAGFAGVAQWFEYGAAALGLCGLAWVSHRAGQMLDRIRVDAVGGQESIVARGQPFGVLLDCVIAAALAFSTKGYGDEPLWHRAVMPVVFLGLVSLVSRGEGIPWRNGLRDRLLLCALLAAIVAGGIAVWAVPALALALLAAAILVPTRLTGLTRA